jgi:opacity protein-like surface antigen
VKSFLSGVAILVLSGFAAACPAAAQGPAGNGAAKAAGNGSSSHSYNPTKWFGKKDNKAAANMPVDELDQKLEPRLRAAQVLAPDASLKDVCNNFVERVDCIAALRATHNLGLNFNCVKASMTGVRTDADASSCRMPTDDKPLNLTKTIRLLKSDADAKSAAKEAETAAREDVKNATP